eukprot:GFYU01004023.1.p1 GENE.GFYU01004023.1~~GFYU01004023.1.p1  ORF type:complete len:221 (-),score=27.42 GFYU01004023.1:239-901(-)
MSGTSGIHHQRKPKRKKLKKARPPSGWLECEKTGSIVAGTSFIPVKTPLSKKHYRISGNDVFTSQDMVDILSRHNVGLVVDLTLSSKGYYPTDPLRVNGIQRVQIKCLAAEGPPQDADVQRFCTIVGDFLSQYPEKRIGVHCTHGHNRTGYFIVEYMMLSQPGTTVEQALQAFDTARPGGILREHLKQSLRDKYASQTAHREMYHSERCSHRTSDNTLGP